VYYDILIVIIQQGISAGITEVFLGKRECPAGYK